MIENLEHIEQFGGDFGVTVIFTLNSQYKSHVEFFAAEITGRTMPDNQPMYWRKGATSSVDDTTDVREAERFVAGTVKWDGCSHIYFGDDNAYIHLCGRNAFDKLTTLLPQIYERCGEMMTERGVDLLESMFVRPDPPTQGKE